MTPALDAIAARLSRPLPPRSAGITLGAVAFFLILVQAATGALLALYYVPAWGEARESVARLSKDVAFGWLIRSLHVWSAHLLVAVVLLHLVRTFIRGAYGRPREVTWLTGVALLGVLMLGAFTGQMLPMDAEAVQGAEVAGAYADELGAGLLIRGGDRIGPPMLTRMFAVHVLWVPAGLLALAAIHLALVGRHGFKGAPAAPGSGSAYPRKLGLSILGAAGAVAILAFAWPVGVGPAPGEAAGSAKPLWMFLPVYQAAKSVSGPWTLVLLLGPPAFLAIVPFLPRRLAVVLGGVLFGVALALGIGGAVA